MPEGWAGFTVGTGVYTNKNRMGAGPALPPTSRATLAPPPGLCGSANMRSFLLSSQTTGRDRGGLRGPSRTGPGNGGTGKPSSPAPGPGRRELAWAGPGLGPVRPYVRARRTHLSRRLAAGGTPVQTPRAASAAPHAERQLTSRRKSGDPDWLLPEEADQCRRPVAPVPAPGACWGGLFPTPNQSPEVEVT